MPRWVQRPQRLVLPPGTYGRVPAWRSRAHWLEEVLPAAVVRGRGVLRRHHIAPDTFVRVMAAHAQHADDDTGRGCTPTVEHIQTLAGCSERTVQRARAAARELRVGVEVFRGRHLTLDERIDAYEAGQTHRGWTSVYALGCPLWLARHLGMPLAAAHPQLNAGVGDACVDGGTPPVGRSTRDSHLPEKNYSSATSAEQRATRATSTRKPRPRGGTARFNPHALALAVALQTRIRTLAGVHPGRLAPTLSRFALAPEPWTAAEVHAVLEHVLRVRGWTWLTAPQHPAAYLARLLREVEHLGPADPQRATDASNRAGELLGRPLLGRPRSPGSESAEALRDLQIAERNEREGRGLCVHGVAGADDRDGRAPRCSYCRRDTSSTSG